MLFGGEDKAAKITGEDEETLERGDGGYSSVGDCSRSGRSCRGDGNSWGEEDDTSVGIIWIAETNAISEVATA